MTKSSKPDSKITLGGKKYIMRQSFEALYKVEKRLGYSVGHLPQRFADNRFGVSEITAIIHSAIDNGGKGVPSYKKVGQLVVADGVYTHLGVAADYLAVALLPAGQGKTKAQK